LVKTDIPENYVIQSELVIPSAARNLQF
jgi:hypothetical protein